MSKPRKKTPVNIIIRNKINSGLRYLSADRRMLPSFIIVGAAKMRYDLIVQLPDSASAHPTKLPKGSTLFRLLSS
jgi:hypothetical protein